GGELHCAGRASRRADGNHRLGGAGAQRGAPAAREEKAAAGGGSRVRIALVTDAWEPQVNGVVRTLRTTVERLRGRGHQVETMTPDGFKTRACPGYPEIRLALGC